MFTKKTNTMKLNANISKGLLAAVIAACFTLQAQAQQPQKDTAKMSHSKMSKMQDSKMSPKKMDKMSDGKKMDKMSGGKMTKKPAGKM
jgi:uncharacterized protein involved in copper resistance